MKALIVVDMQNDFMEHGALAVPGADDAFAFRVKSYINHLLHSPEPPMLVFTQDTHPMNHEFFAENHNDKRHFEIDLDGNTFWPAHCVIGDYGWEFHPLLQHITPYADVIIRKGMNRFVDSYSAFFDNDGVSSGLGAMLTTKGVNEIEIIGLALDYCVAWTALDASTIKSMAVTVNAEFCKAINPGHNMQRELNNAGVFIKESNHV